MAEGEAVRGKPGRQRRAAHTGLNRDDLRLGVDADEPVHPGHVERDHTGEAGTDGDQAADHRRPPTERNHREPMAAADREHGVYLVVACGQDDRVRGIHGVAGAKTQQVGRGPPTAVPDQARPVVADPGRAEHAHQGRVRVVGKAAHRQPQRVSAHRWGVPACGTQNLFQQGADTGGQRCVRLRRAPAPPDHPAVNSRHPVIPPSRHPAIMNNHQDSLSTVTRHTL